MKYYFKDPEFPVVFDVPTVDFVNFNIVENFENKPESFRITELFKTMDIHFPSGRDAKDLANGIQNACALLDKPLTFEDLKVLEDCLLYKVIFTHHRVCPLDDYDVISNDELLKWWN